MAVDKALMSGSMTMLLLRLLAEKDMYGYEMIDILRKKSCNVFELKAGTLYPLLHGIGGERICLRSYEQEYGGKTRKYYSITKEGRSTARMQRQAEWKRISICSSQCPCNGGCRDGRVSGETVGANPLQKSKAVYRRGDKGTYRKSDMRII